MDTEITPIEQVLPPQQQQQSVMYEDPVHSVMTSDENEPPPQPSMYYHQPPPQRTTHSHQNPKKTSGFPDFDKFTYIVIAVALLVGFFMGKSTHPIILKHS